LWASPRWLYGDCTSEIVNPHCANMSVKRLPGELAKQARKHTNEDLSDYNFYSGCYGNGITAEVSLEYALSTLFASTAVTT
jgi:hypothetical protein